MNVDAPPTVKDQREKQNILLEVANAEKKLWTLIISKGILHPDVQDLYRKARASYENIILSDQEVVELQDVEYSLWKLHYKHIDEFRKRKRQSSANSESIKTETPQVDANVHSSIDSHMEGFKLFLSEATAFYKELIAKLRKCCGLPEDPLLYKKGDGSFSVEPTKLHKCEYACHRFLVCLGDLARYGELCKKTDIQNLKWSLAATYYFQATMVWPDSGNPQNQLALLATYIGVDFLALYHCIRSLAVKEPFPDAWDNLMLLFEKNRSSQLHSLSNEIHFDFLKPSERSSQTKLHARSGSSNNNFEGSELLCSGKTDLWPLFVRMISFFFIRSSLEDFPCTFAATVRELEALVALDDTKLEVLLQSYDHIDSARRGPFRALQVVSILIFVIRSLSESAELKEPKEKNDAQQSTLTQLAWAATFIFMGRLLERCLKGNQLDCCPLLAAVLVFVEWLVSMADEAEKYGADEKVTNALSYFFGAFVLLLNRLCIKEGEVSSLDHTALWEDYELRGFVPMAHAHVSLDFTTDWDCMCKYNSRNINRAHRILRAAMKIVDRSNDSGKWIFYDKLRRKFYTEKFPDERVAEGKDAHHQNCLATKEYEKDIPVENHADRPVKGESVALDEEEVILFKPITRYNSAPLHTYLISDDQMSMEGISSQTTTSDECLRRATSLFAAQNQARIDPLDCHLDTNNFRCNKPFMQQEPLLKDSATYPAGPPSLSAWVLNRECLNIERDTGKLELNLIEEIPSASLTSLSINETKDSAIGSRHFPATIHDSSPPYVAPVPSAPLLPDDAAWFRSNSSSFSESKSPVGIKEEDGILGAAPVGGYSNWSATHGPFDFCPGVPDFIDGYPPLLGMSSSEWLYQYTNNHNLERANNHIWPAPFNAPLNLGNLPAHDASRFDLFDRWGNPLVSNRMVYLESPQLYPSPPLVYGADEQRREKFFLGYQRPSPYGCGTGTDLKSEQPPLLQYLKDREWQPQRESQVRGPTYMGN